ncbi:hypothetical protein Peur_000985 [Populus x canadensis]
MTESQSIPVDGSHLSPRASFVANQGSQTHTRVSPSSSLGSPHPSPGSMSAALKDSGAGGAMLAGTLGSPALHSDMKVAPHDGV